MAGNLNALGLILVFLLTAAVLTRYGAWPRSLWHVVGGLAAAFGVMFVAECLTTVLYYEANQSHQILIPSACLALLFIFTGPSRIRAIATTAVAVSMLVWSVQVLCLVGPYARYTGDPAAARRTCRVIAYSHLRQIRKAYDGEQDRHNHAAGWLVETEVGRKLPEYCREYMKSPAVAIRPFWHTPLTGLYSKTYHELSLWYPGGPLKQGLAHLEFRPR